MNQNSNKQCAQGHISEKYSDIIDMPHHVSKNHPQMSMKNRAAQFAPFAALTGFDKAIEATAESSFVKSASPRISHAGDDDELEIRY